MKLVAGIIGFGRMGEFYLEDMLVSGQWTVKYICDVSERARQFAAAACPSAIIVEDEDIIFNDSEVQVVVLVALADSRPSQIAKAVSAGKHIIAVGWRKNGSTSFTYGDYVYEAGIISFEFSTGAEIDCIDIILQGEKNPESTMTYMPAVDNLILMEK